ncbi:ATP-dependent DNA helicase Q4 isoform X1 [Synchiropus splendidus]|uniref:ATP-dependent DNA helicase Q4 isoform X1 n=2 Tax=Synchiropus splendidus TaxID=270530 RepID=UPI00237DDCF2|nr:ATP-dependent DNA helicase Q4 isoform X1 [Synchiropus splendidus]
MDRYNEVKHLLKNWEQGFYTQHLRKPNKEDIDQAPEETRSLYKEYRHLKHAKENNDTRERVPEESVTSTQQPTAEKSSGCWGAHLNRNMMPTPSPKLTAEDKEGLQSSAQYYGLKLKSNLATLGKERSISLKKPSNRGRLPLNALKDGPSAQADDTSPSAAKNTSHISEPGPFSPRSTKPGSFSTPSLHPEEPEEEFEPFQTIKEPSKLSGDTSAAKPAGNSSLCRTPIRNCPSLLSSHSAPEATSPTDSPEKFIKTKDDANDKYLGMKMRNGILGSPQNVGGFRGGLGCKVTPARPSPANRLSAVDRQWLERCQVFGEMGAEDKPGAGNKDVTLTKSDADRGKDRKPEDTTEVAINVPGTSENLKENQNENTIERQSRGDITTKSLKDDCEENPKPPTRKNKGRKRQREGEDTDVGTAEVEEGGMKKRRRNVTKSEENKDSQDGGDKKKRKSRKKENGDAETEDEKAPKDQKKMPQENLLGEIEEEYGSKRGFRVQTSRASMKGAEGNYVKINLKKKSHVKGYALRGSFLRKQLYAQKFQLKGERFGGGGGFFGRGRRGGFRGGHSRQSDTCYKCGGTGHWAMDCKGRVPPPTASEDKPVEEEQFELPTLEEVARATGTLKPQPIGSSVTATEEQQEQVASQSKDEVLLNVIRPDYERPPVPPRMEPLYPADDDGKVQATPDAVFAALKDLGYQSFRPGQEEAIMRILSGLSTLVVLSTGMGKSLCYQLPAYLYAQRSRCITLVISPLVSLMDDQLSGLPAKMKAACIHSNMTMKQREAAVEKVKSGEVYVLLLSPEALVGGGSSGSGCLPSAQELPPVAFACIDEAHCVSEWSHNFRPCYLRLCKVLRERLGVHCLLGLTATATLSTALDIAQHLEITDQDGIAVRSAAVPPNLNLSVSMDREKDQALVSLLKGDRFGCLNSIIVYCTRREETTRVAALLRTCLQGVLLKENPEVSQTQNKAGDRKKLLARKKIRKPLKWQAESYHAGLSGSERRRVQNNFMCGELRIVVATVAFGMGLDKSDVRGIVHYNMPKSFESYVQEIGRAGRDGEPAHCHLFLDPEASDLHELRRHIYSDTVDYFTVKRLVQKVFPSCKCRQIHQRQQELTKDIEDSEMLEMMDLCEVERTSDACYLQDTEENLKGADRRTGQENNSEEGETEEDVRPAEIDGAEKQAEVPVMTGGDQQGEPVKEAYRWPEERVCHTHERAVPIQETIEALDITEEGIETLLCYLELHPQRFVELLHSTLSVCKVSCYNGPRQLQKITKICPPVAVVLARRRMSGERVETCDQLEFDVVEVADTMGWQLPLVKRGLRQLQWSTDQTGGRSGIMVEFSSPSFYFRSFGDLSDEEMDRVCQFLHNRVQEQEKTQLYQLTACFKAFKSVAFRSVMPCVDALDEGRSVQLKSLLAEYFDKRRDREHTLQPLDVDELDKFKFIDWENQIRADIRSFLSTRSDEKFSGRAIARIFHGIGSPCFPAQVYGRDRRFWRKYIQFDFNQLIRLATQEIIRFK